MKDPTETFEVLKVGPHGKNYFFYYLKLRRLFKLSPQPIVVFKVNYSETELFTFEIENNEVILARLF